MVIGCLGSFWCLFRTSLLLQLHDNTSGVTVLSQHFLSSSEEERNEEDAETRKSERKDDIYLVIPSPRIKRIPFRIMLAGVSSLMLKKTAIVASIFSTEVS